MDLAGTFTVIEPPDTIFAPLKSTIRDYQMYYDQQDSWM